MQRQAEGAGGHLTPRPGLAAAAVRHEAEVPARHPRAEGIKAVLRDIVARSGPAPRHGGGGEGDGRGEGEVQGKGDA